MRAGKRKRPAAETSGLEIGTVLGGMYYSAVTKAFTRLETEMTLDKGLRNV